MPAPSRRTSELAVEIGKKGPFDPREEAYLNLARTYNMLATEYNHYFKDHNLTQPQYNVLRILRGHGARVSVYQISGEMVTQQSDMPRLIDRLEARGYVVKKRCDKDRRIVWVALTKQGKDILRKIDSSLGKLHQQLLGHMSKKQLAELSHLLCLTRQPNATSG